MTKFKVKGGNTVELNQSHFIFKGGEGSVYGKGRTAYKIVEPGHMIPSGKIIELEQLTLPNIIKPERLILNLKGEEVGYTMKLVPSNYPLCQLFTGFKADNNIGQKTLNDIVKQLVGIMDHAHSQKCLIVDMNELNFLVTEDHKDLFAIDVNSWQTKSYPATAIMESIRDVHAKSFGVESDIFSLAMLTFQIWASVNPYKGKHPDYTGKPSKRFNERRESNVSVFDKKTLVPNSATLSAIPKSWISWFKSVFDSGYRGPPPKVFDDIAVVVSTIKRLKSNGFAVTELFECDEKIIRVAAHLNELLIVTDKKVHYNGQTVNRTKPGKIWPLFTYNNADPITVQLEDEQVVVTNHKTHKIVTSQLKVSDVMVYNNRLYCIQGTKLLEVSLNGTMLSYKQVGSILDIPKAIKVFPGVIMQNMLNKRYATIVEKNICHQVKIDELDKYKVVEACYRNGFLVVVGHCKGQYDRLMFHIVNGKVVNSVKMEDVQLTSINMNVTDAGVMVLINEDDEIEMCRDLRSIKVMKDAVVNGSLRFVEGNQILAIDHKRVVKVSTK